MLDGRRVHVWLAPHVVGNVQFKLGSQVAETVSVLIDPYNIEFPLTFMLWLCYEKLLFYTITLKINASGNSMVYVYARASYLSNKVCGMKVMIMKNAKLNMLCFCLFYCQVSSEDKLYKIGGGPRYSSLRQNLNILARPNARKNA